MTEQDFGLTCYLDFRKECPKSCELRQRRIAAGNLDSLLLMEDSSRLLRSVAGTGEHLAFINGEVERNKRLGIEVDLCRNYPIT